MPNTQFLEEYPLYRKFDLLEPLPIHLHLIPKVKVHLPCSTCKSDQTFIMANDYAEGHTHPPRSASAVITLRYLCAGCESFRHTFTLKIDPDLRHIAKVGQEPAWTIPIDKTLSKGLGEHRKLFTKGLISESQGYGIGAYAYYRRVVEDVIGDLLGSILNLIEPAKQAEYQAALENTRKTRVAQEKIELVKDLLPASLRPDGMNPLATLHDILSDGLHGKSDEECMEIATGVREILAYLVTETLRHKEAQKEFTTNMQRLLAKKGGAKKPD